MGLLNTAQGIDTFGVFGIYPRIMMMIFVDIKECFNVYVYVSTLTSFYFLGF